MPLFLSDNNTNNFICQDRRLRGSFSFNLKYTIKDLFGWSAGTKGGLKALAESLNIKMLNKNDLDDYKGNMLQALKNKPVTFIRYGFGDIYVLIQIFWKKIKTHNKLLKHVFGLKHKYVFNQFDFPLTNGSLINKSFIKLLMNYAESEGVSGEFLLTIHKLGILNTSHSDYKKNVKKFNKIFSSKQNIKNAIKECAESENKNIKNLFFNYDCFEFTVFNSASIPMFLTSDSKTNSALNAIVTGGRTINERPEIYHLDYAADIDLQSCYVSALQGFTFPIGLPTVISASSNEQRIKLGEFLKQYENNLVPNLWKITVCGELNFKQDLIYSRVISKGSLSNFYKNENLFQGDFDELNFLHSKLALIRYEISNGVITHDILEVLKKVCSSQEWKSFMNLFVETAVFWKKDDQVESLKEWTEIVLNDNQQLKYNPDIQGLSDKRTRAFN